MLWIWCKGLIVYLWQAARILIPGPLSQSCRGYTRGIEQPYTKPTLIIPIEQSGLDCSIGKTHDATGFITRVTYTVCACPWFPPWRFPFNWALATIDPRLVFSESWVVQVNKTSILQWSYSGLIADTVTRTVQCVIHHDRMTVWSLCWQENHSPVKKKSQSSSQQRNHYAPIFSESFWCNDA
jgi:hypothetical protein